MVTLRSGQRWLIDCGRQAPDQLHAAGFVWHDITGQVVTHVHGDHVYGMEDFAFIRYFESRGADLACSLYLRGLRRAEGGGLLPETSDPEARIERLRRNVDAFVSRVTTE